ncbi:hypothetical protein CRUP_033491, partial [Coryphaenoides rupestris]
PETAKKKKKKKTTTTTTTTTTRNTDAGQVRSGGLHFMGMCSRQERIQKDVDIVLQRCKAEKDCLFSDFRYIDSTFTFLYAKGSKRVTYAVHVSDDYPDNTYVSNSENNDDVLITTDAIPAIFHRIASEIRPNIDPGNSLFVKSKLQLDKNQYHYAIEEDSEGDNDSEEFYYGGQVSTITYAAPCIWEYGAIDDVDIDLHIDVSFLDVSTLNMRKRLPWHGTVVRREPVDSSAGFTCSLDTVPKWNRIMQTFVTQQWKSKDQLHCPHSRKLNDKKVKSPLHIFSTLHRSPSYPPPGCIKSKKKLKPEQDGVSKSHRLLRRSCSSAVKQQVEAQVDGFPGAAPSKSAHKLLGHALSGGVRVETAHPILLKSHRLLGRGPGCPAAVKPEDCGPGLRPVPGKLFAPRSCPGDPHCDPPGGEVSVGGISGGISTGLGVGGGGGGGLKGSQRLLSRSCSGSIKAEEMDGLKHHHRVLSHSYSNSSRMGKADIFKDSVPEVRRLSLTSGLFAILAPSLAMPPAPNNGAKLVSIGDKGFLVQIMEYAKQRIPVLNEFCVVCDEPHVFENGPMLRPTVCERELCVFAFQTLGVMNEAADEIATGAQVVDLLVSMCRSALESPRKDVIFEPYPSVVDPNDPQTLAFNPRKKDYDRVMRALDSLTSIREMTQAPYLEIKKQMDKHDSLAHPLLQWVISSNRSHIVKLPVPRQLKFMHTPHQFLLLSSPPAKESNFRSAKNLFGSTFAFQSTKLSLRLLSGSHIENWHSILRNGLVVASNTRLQLHGAIYGNGIYLSPLSSISFGYSGMNKRQQKVTSKDEMAASSKANIHLQSHKKGQQPQFLQSRNLKCIALCEVITSPDLHKHGDIWVVPSTDHVCTRFFFVYEDGQVGDSSLNTQDNGIHREILRVIGNQT